MRPLDLPYILTGGIVLLLIAVFAVRVSQHYPTARAELSRVKLMQLEEGVPERLSQMQHEALVTYYVSTRSQMPSSLRRIERDVEDLLKAMRAASNGRFDFQIVNPDARVAPEQALHEARRLTPGIMATLAGEAEAGAAAWQQIRVNLEEAFKRAGASEQDARRVAVEIVERIHAERPGQEQIEKLIQDGMIEAGGSFARFAAHQRVSPFRVRTVSRDSYSEQTVWSTLHIAYGPDSAVINGISPEHLPRLQSLIIGQIEQKDHPREPIFGVAAPRRGYGQFKAWLGQHGRVIDIDISEPIPDEIDVLFWFEPEEVPTSLIRRLNEFLQDGRSMVVAGSRHHFRELDEPWAFEFSRTNYDAEALLTAFGLRPIDGLILDEFSQTVPGEVAPMPARFLIRCIAPNQDFRTTRGMPNGHLLFTAPTPFALDGDLLAQRGYSPTILATTSDGTSVRDMVYGRLRLDREELQPGELAPKLPLMVWLRPDKPWQGSIIFTSSTSPFRDGAVLHENFAHRRMIDVLAATLASDERLVIHRSGIERPAPLPEMSAGSRLFWRGVCIFLIPVLLGLLAYWRGVFRNTTDSPRAGRSLAAAINSGLPLRAAVGLIVVVVLASVAVAVGGGALRADLTRDKLNELAPQTRAIAAAARGDQAVTANLYFSRPEHLPPSMRPMLRQLRTMLHEIGRAGADLTVVWHFPDDLDDADRELLAARGIKPVRATSRDEEITTVRNIYCTVELVIESGGESRRELLEFPDGPAFENIEFRIAFALWRLQSGQRPHIVFIADIPRLSAAEVYHDFQQQNLMAPTGTDVHSHSRKVLERAGFRVTHVNPRRPRLPDEPADLILWMQPRRDILQLLEPTVERLHQGVPVIIASQHFVIQSRQFRGTAFEMVYWPQPQVTDLDLHYFPTLGINLVREVLFDDVRATMTLESHVNVGVSQREYVGQASALPFLVRAIASNFDRAHPMMRGVGDQMMPFPNYIRFDDERLESLGLAARPLILSSDRTWSLDWRGGWIPKELLGDRPPTDDDLPGTARLHSQRLPLAVLVEGRFPLPAQPLTHRRLDERTEIDFSDAVGEPSKLLLIGNSYMFRNERIFEPEFRADHLLLNAAAYLALDESLAAIASHRRVAPGFDFIEPEDRLMWRAIVVSAGPLVLLTFGAMWWIGRSRRSRIIAELGGRSPAAQGTDEPHRPADG